MNEMVERVAFATCSSIPCICRNRLGFTGMPCLDRGRAAIAAMREPTPAMMAAMDFVAVQYGLAFAIPVDGEPVSLGFVQYKAAIDEALK